MSVLKECQYGEKFTILEQNAGLHFILKVDSSETDRALVERCARAGIRVRALGDYFHGGEIDDTHCLVVNYGGLKSEDVAALADALNKI
jgi:GntR family transcriptional regulator/MocR family aminotransferase